MEMEKSETSLEIPTSPKPDLDETNIDSRKRKIALGLILKNGCLLLLVLWIDTVWLYGSFFNSNNRVSQLNILVADFDGGSIGTSFLKAVSTINNQPTSPNFQILQSNTTSPEEMLDSLFKGEVWGVIYTSINSSLNFENALNSNATTAVVKYTPENVIMYSGLEVRFSTTFSGFILPAFLQVIGITNSIFDASTIAPLLLKPNTLPQAKILLNPIGSTFINLTPFNFGSRVMFNTLGTVLPLLLQFFFLLGMNGIFMMNLQYKNKTLKQLLKIRLPIQLIWTLLTSLSFSGWCLIYQETFTIGSVGNFFALWTINFVYAFITFDTLDSVMAFIPMPFQPPIIVSIILLSVASTALPIDLTSPFFKIHYIFPPHAIWSTIIVILGKGATGYSTLRYNLPILAGWLIGVKILAIFGLRKRGRDGMKVVGGGGAGH